MKHAPIGDRARCAEVSRTGGPRLTASVVIVTHCRPSKLRAAVAAVLSQTRLPDELIIVNDAGDGATTAAVADLAPTVPSTVLLRHLTIPGNSIAVGENYGMLAARGDVIVFTDDDAEARPDWLDRIMREYRRPEVGGVCGHDIVDHDGVPVTGTVRAVGQITWRGSKKGFFHLEGAPRQQVSVMKGVNMSVRRTLAVLLDEHLLGPNEACWEDDLSLAVKGQGFQLWFDPGIVVIHHRAGGRVAEGQQFIYFHNETYVILKHVPLIRKCAFLMWSFTIGAVTQLVHAVRQREWGLVTASLAGRCAGIRTYVRARWREGRTEALPVQGCRR